MTPQEVIADLDASLAQDGTPAVLQRRTLGPGGLQVAFSVDVLVFVKRIERGTPELATGIGQEHDLIILSPTQVEAKGWPGPANSGMSADERNSDRRVPAANKKDRFIVGGIARTVTSTHPVYMQGVLVRLECRVTG